MLKPFAPLAVIALVSMVPVILGTAQADTIAPDEVVPFYIEQDIATEEAARKTAIVERLLGQERQATPNQLDWDATYYSLDLTLDPSASLLTGTVIAQGEVTGPGIATVELDLLGNMTVSAVRESGSPTTFSHSANILTINLGHTYLTGESFSVEVDYSGNPAGESFGWDWHSGQRMIWTLSEPYGARAWWPCKDWPLDKADGVDIYVTIESSLIVASNGTLVSVTPHGGQNIYHWQESYPITTYLVSLAIHPYSEYSLYYNYAPTDSMEIKYYVYPDHMGQVQATYGMVPNMIEHFVAIFGEYPFLDEKYGHAEFEWGGGMEHQTITSLGGWSEMLINHELAHMWWGDYITCNSFHHIWLNEGFATYSESLYLEREYGVQAMHNDMANNAYFGGGSVYVYDPVGNPGSIFNGNLSYRKGSWVLHMLRHVLGDEDFFTTLQTYYTQLGNSTATTEQLQAVAESVSGIDLTAFFQQWVYGEYFPIYMFDWNAVEQTDSWEITLDIDQLQTNQVFVMPIDVEIELAGGGSEIQVVQNDLATQQFVLTVADEPVAIRLDPDNWILRQLLVPLENPTFDQGILVVNGVDWGTYGAEITQAYEESAFWGEHTIAFWDVFDAPGGGYPSTLPTPLGHGPVDPAVMGQYSSVVWVGNDYGGDLAHWFNSPNISYVSAGGNLLLMTRHGQSFFIDPLREYLGIEWTNAMVNLNTQTATYTGLVNMPRISTMSRCATFDRDQLGPATALLFEDQSFNPDAGTGAWRTNPGDGGEFVFISGRPYRWNRTALHDNTDYILRHLFGEGTGSAVHQPGPGRAYRLLLGECVPNPMNPSTRIPFELPAAGLASIKIYDVAGRLVRNLLEEPLAAGPQGVVWDGRNATGQEMRSGVYYVRLVTPAGEQTRSVTLLR